jgi:hypothetical protein
MRVELPKLLSVLSHELRSPLGVVQGYIRLLQRQKADNDQEQVMLKAMLAATGRMTAITRQASELGAWLRAADAPPEPVTVEALAGLVREQLGDKSIAVEVDSEAALASLAARDRNMLAGALAAVAESSARDLGNVPMRMTMTTDGVAAVLVAIGPQPGTAPAADAPPPSGPVTFDRGGLGLGLVLASYVLEGHAADVTRVQPSGMIEIRLQKNRGLV